MQRDDLMVWVDLEMTSIQDVRIDRITEIAVVLTDKDLTVVAELPSIIIHADRELYESRIRPEMAVFPQQMKLIEDAMASTTTMEEAENTVLAFLEEYVVANSAPLCGNSIHMDRHFLRMQMPRVEHYLFYRCIDVSTIKELARRWAPDVYTKAQEHKGESSHRAVDDIYGSIKELTFYREHFLKS
jgi:oligoribonuclease